MTAELQVSLDRPLPESVAVGRPTAVFCVGTCFHRESDVADLTLVIDGTRHRPAAQRMPRLDCEVYRSGFWGTVPIRPPATQGELTLMAEGRLADGATAVAPLGAIAVVEPPEAPRYEIASGGTGKALIAICMATYNPDLELFHTQIDSIRAQTDTDWICVISDDCSDAEYYDAIVETVAGDPRFVLSRGERRLNFYRNFERVLWMVPPEAELVALSDHDDRWYPDKLATLREAIGSAELAYSDLRRVDRGGGVRGETLWRGRRNNHTNLASLVISNTIAGAACLFRRRVLDRALPFPDAPGWNFHDHWLAAVALAMGDVAYVDRPLYDYVQHPRAVLGRVTSNPSPPSDRSRAELRGRPGRGHTFLRRWRSAYFSIYLHRQLQAEVLLTRCADRLTPRKRRGLRLLVAAAHSPLAFLWLVVRPARALVGRNETLRTEGVLAKGIAWRHLIALRTRGRDRPTGAAEDARMPAFEPQTFGKKRRRWLAEG